MNTIAKVTYHDHLARLKEQYGDEEGTRLAIGDPGFDAFGLMEKDLLISCGLKASHDVIDIGCGSGRLASKLASYLTGNYLGLDIVEELLDYARTLANMPHWRFEVASTPYTLPAQDESTDFVSCFSVFTHLLHEYSYLYLKDTFRVLRPGGKCVFSFLEFKIPAHWRVFEETVEAGDHSIMNQFIEREAIRAWAEHLGFDIENIWDGDKPHFPLQQPVTLEDGQVFKHEGHLGQSVCVLVKPG